MPHSQGLDHGFTTGWPKALRKPIDGFTNGVSAIGLTLYGVAIGLLRPQTGVLKPPPIGEKGFTIGCPVIG